MGAQGWGAGGGGAQGRAAPLLSRPDRDSQSLQAYVERQSGRRYMLCRLFYKYLRNSWWEGIFTT